MVACRYTEANPPVSVKATSLSRPQRPAASTNARERAPARGFHTNSPPASVPGRREAVKGVTGYTTDPSDGTAVPFSIILAGDLDEHADLEELAARVVEDVSRAAKVPLHCVRPIAIRSGVRWTLTTCVCVRVACIVQPTSNVSPERTRPHPPVTHLHYMPQGVSS